MRWLIYIFVFFCFFPYINIINIGTDTQPNALVMASILLFAVQNKRLNTSIVLLWILFFLSFALAFFSNLSTFETIKNILNYLSTPLICFAAYNVFIKDRFQLPFKVFLFFVAIYFIVGFVQLFVNPGFMTFLLNQGARGVMLGGRGVVSLCPEPAFYGSLCLFMMVFSLLSYSFRQNILAMTLLVIQLVFFAQSATSILVFLISILVFFIVQLVRFRARYIAYALVLSALVVYAYQTQYAQFSESRAGVLIGEIIENPELIAQVDVSAGVRITSTISPFLAARHNAFLPMGWGNYRNFISRLNRSGRYPKLLNKYIVREIGRLGGGINMILFHLGFLGLLFPLAIWLAFKKLIKVSKIQFAFILFFLLLFTQIQLMQSMIGFILATALYMSHYSNRMNLKENIHVG